MTTFHDLFRQPTQAVNGVFPPDCRAELFPALVERSRKLHLWAPGQATSDVGPRLLIGIAVWSECDLELLDVIENATHTPVRIDVFILDQCRSLQEIRRFVPDVQTPHHSPVVGLWRDGVLVESASGFHGRQLVCRVLGLDPTEAEAQMTAARVN
jgi:hypothetical protein